MIPATMTVSITLGLSEKFWAATTIAAERFRWAVPRQLEFTGVAGGSWDYRVVAGTTLVAVAFFGDETALFDLSAQATAELGAWAAPVPGNTVNYGGDGDRIVVSDLFTTYVTAGALDGGEMRMSQGDLGGLRVEVSGGGRFVASADPTGLWQVRVVESDEVVYEAPEGWTIRGVSHEGTLALIHPLTAFQSIEECHPHLVSTVDGSIVAELTNAECSRAFFSPDGDLVYVRLGLFDTDSGECVGMLDSEAFSGFEAAFAPDGGRLVLGTWEGPVYVVDVSLLASGASSDEAVIREISAHEGGVMRVSVSPDGLMAATWSWTEPLKVWDLDTGQLVDEFGGRIDDGLFRDGDFHPSLPQLVVISPPNEVRIHTLDIDELIAIAETGLSRDMTEEECQQYFRQACGGS